MHKHYALEKNVIFTVVAGSLPDIDLPDPILGKILRSIESIADRKNIDTD